MILELQNERWIWKYSWLAVVYAGIKDDAWGKEKSTRALGKEETKNCFEYKENWRDYEKLFKRLKVCSALR